MSLVASCAVIWNKNSYFLKLAAINVLSNLMVPVAGLLNLAFLGQVLRNSSVLATVVGFLPVALVGWQLQNIHVLWLEMATFMLTRALTLGWQVRYPPPQPR